MNVDYFTKSKEKKPEAYYLCDLSDGNTSYIGWWTGSEWYGRKLPEDYKVKYWKIHHKIIF